MIEDDVLAQGHEVQQRVDKGVTARQCSRRSRRCSHTVAIDCENQASEKIEAVALQVGYRNKRQFIRQFKSHMGILPSHFRGSED